MMNESQIPGWAPETMLHSEEGVLGVSGGRATLSRPRLNSPALVALEGSGACDREINRQRFDAIARRQACLSDDLDLSRDQLVQNSARLQGVVSEANQASTSIMRSQLQHLGIELESPGSARRQRGPGPWGFGALRQVRRGERQQVALDLQQAQTATHLLKKYVEQESVRCEMVRNDVFARMDLIQKEFAEWLEFFRVALDMAQGQQRHEVQQGLRLMEARESAVSARLNEYRETVRLHLDVEESAQRKKRESEHSKLSSFLQRRRCEAEIESMDREISLRERAELHGFDIEKQKVELQKRRNDQEFITSLIGQGLQAAKAAIL